MTNHVARFYAIAITLVVFFVTWAVVSARPWAASATSKKDPRLVALQQREARVHQESIRVGKVLTHRYRVYRVKLHERKRQIRAIEAANARVAAKTVTVASPASSWSATSAPSVSVVTAPPVTSTHTS